jgi:hypothetical protein
MTMNMQRIASLVVSALLGVTSLSACAMDGDPQEALIKSDLGPGLPSKATPLENLSPDLQDRFLNAFGPSPNLRIICDVGSGCANCCTEGGTCCAACNGQPAVCTR